MPNINERKSVANLLRSVIVGNCSVREAMLLFPKDTSDESIIAAYHALIHYEADEDLRVRDVLYREEQDDYIEFLSQILEKGDDLPKNIIENYKTYHETAPILHKNNIQGFFKGFLKNLTLGFRKEDI